MNEKENEPLTIKFLILTIRNLILLGGDGVRNQQKANDGKEATAANVRILS